MRFWLINPYGPIPGEGWRDYRFTMLGRELANDGHEVVWWTGNFAHHFKRRRSEGWEDRVIEPGFIIRLVPTLGYRRNIGMGRVAFELMFSWRVLCRAIHEPRPDCLFATVPDPLSAEMQLWIARWHKTALIADFFDLYPEIFLTAVPPRMRMFARPIIAALTQLRNTYLARANGVAAVSDEYRGVAERAVPELANGRSITAYIGADVNGIRSSMEGPVSSVPRKLERTTQGKLRAIYAGSLGENYDIHTLISAARILRTEAPTVTLVIAGDGPLRTLVERESKTSGSSVLFLGKVAATDLGQIYKLCHIGLIPYIRDSTVAMPTKLYDYTAAGLPFLYSLSGDLHKIASRADCGVQYSAGDARNLAETIKLVAANPDRRRKMADNAYRAAGEFDSATQYRKLREFLVAATTNARVRDQGNHRVT